MSLNVIKCLRIIGFENIELKVSKKVKSRSFHYLQRIFKYVDFKIAVAESTRTKVKTLLILSNCFTLSSTEISQRYPEKTSR